LHAALVETGTRFALAEYRKLEAISLSSTAPTVSAREVVAAGRAVEQAAQRWEQIRMANPAPPTVGVDYSRLSLVELETIRRILEGAKIIT
jgi:hypothetical protein